MQNELLPSQEILRQSPELSPNAEVVGFSEVDKLAQLAQRLAEGPQLEEENSQTTELNPAKPEIMTVDPVKLALQVTGLVVAMRAHKMQMPQEQGASR